MTSNVDTKVDRRSFFKGVAIAAGAASLSSPLPVAIGATGAAAIAQSGIPGGAESAPEGGYRSLGPDEAAFVEALVNVMCPADGLTPNGVDCGLAVYIDHQLAGGFGKGERLYMRGPWKQGKPQHGYQLPLTPEQFFKAGLAQANSVASRKSDPSFAELTPDEPNAILRHIAAH